MPCISFPPPKEEVFNQCYSQTIIQNSSRIPSSSSFCLALSSRPSCSTTKSYTISAVDLAIFNCWVVLSLSSRPILTASLRMISLMAVYCRKVMLRERHSSSSSLEMYITFLSDLSTALSFLATRRVLLWINALLPCQGGSFPLLVSCTDRPFSSCPRVPLRPLRGS